jgi:hypothetical protein
MKGYIKKADKFSKLLRRSVSPLLGKGLQDDFSFQMYPRVTTHRCVAGNVLSGPELQGGTHGCVASTKCF